LVVVVLALFLSLLLGLLWQEGAVVERGATLAVRVQEECLKELLQ